MPKSASQLKSEIQAYLAQPEYESGTALSFPELIRRDEPRVMEIAEELARRRGWQLRGLTGATHGRNFTIELRPTWGHRDKWKMVQTNVAEDKPGRVWVKISVANGPVRVSREREYKGRIGDDARKLAVANAWAVAKAIKYLPLNADQKTIERIVDDRFARRTMRSGPNAKIADIL